MKCTTHSRAVLNIRLERPRPDSQCRSKLCAVDQAVIAPTPLDSADIVAMQAGLEAELLLRPPAALA